MNHDHVHDRVRADDRQSAEIIPFRRRPLGNAQGDGHMHAMHYGARRGTVDRRPILRTIAGGRSERRPDYGWKDTIAMNGSNLGLSHMYAASRHAEFVAEAERERLIARIPVRGGSAAPSAIRGLRMRVGSALIRFGEKLHGTVDERCADLGAGSLRPARS